MTRAIWAPRPWQPAMIDHALNLPRSALWVPMGMGKTVVALTVLNNLQLSGDDTRPALILAPLRVAEFTWSDEAAKWEHLTDLSVQPLVGDPAQRQKGLAKPARAFTLNYEQLVWLVEKFKNEPWPFGTLVLDEATKLKGLRVSLQTSKKGTEFVKGQGSVRAKALSKIAFKPGGVSGVLELTGAPAPNGLKDLWGQVWFLDAGRRLGRTFTGFKSRWFETRYDEHTLIPRPYAHAQIMEACRDLCLSVEPPPMDKPYIINRYVTLRPQARAIYDKMEKKMFVELQGQDIEAFNAATKTLKCLQIANGALYGDDQKFIEVHDEKLTAMESLVEECAGNPLMVAYHFKSDLARLRAKFPHGLDLADRDDMAQAKQGRGTVWFAHPASVGHGIDGLQHHCNRIAFFGHWWDLDHYMQIIERIGPMRQLQANTGKPVYVYHILAKDTVDEMVMARRDSKREVQDILLDYMKRKKND